MTLREYASLLASTIRWRLRRWRGMPKCSVCGSRDVDAEVICGVRRVVSCQACHTWFGWGKRP